MPMIPVRSSNMHSHNYDPVEERYSVAFNCGKCQGDGCPDCSKKGHTGFIYHYTGVPAEKYAKIRESSSPGAAFHAEIVKYKDPDTGKGYAFQKVPA